MDTFKVKIATPEACVFDGPADSIVAPGTGGEFGVLAHHAPMIAAISEGVLKVALSGNETFAFNVGDGVLEVAADQVLVLTGKAVRKDWMAGGGRLRRVDQNV